jgi:hypothetical protein
MTETTRSVHIEAVAKAISTASPGSEAETAVTAFVKSLEEHGLIIAPEFSTEQMAYFGDGAIGRGHNAGKVYQLMRQAAPRF